VSHNYYINHYVILRATAPERLLVKIRGTEKKPYVIAETEDNVLLSIGADEMTCEKKHIKSRVRREGKYVSMKVHVWTPEANTRLMQRFHARDFKGMTRAHRTQINKWILRRHRLGRQGKTMLGDYRGHEPFGETDLYCLATVQTNDGIKNKANTVSHLAEVLGRPEIQVYVWLMEISNFLAEQGLGIITSDKVTPKMFRDYAYPQSEGIRSIIGKLPDGPKPVKDK